MVTNKQKMEQYRHEFKYLINSWQLEKLKGRLSEIMFVDPHTDGSGQYEVRSLYFDDYYNSCYFENENGLDPREKFRIRIYNGSAKNISLELKRKECGMTLKRKCSVTQEQVECLISDGLLSWRNNMDPLLNKIFLLQETRLMRPKVIVEYDRIPFIYPDGNVRITLDMNIRASLSIGDFLDKKIRCKPIMPLGIDLLEVKYDNFLPDFIYRNIQMKELRQTAFSKYYLCRKLGGVR